MKTAGLILAAGCSSRAGQRNKLLFPMDGSPMINHIAQLACLSDLDDVYVITGYQSDQVEQAIVAPVQFIYNPEWKNGMGTSIIKGVSVIEEEYEYCMIILGDMPYITLDLIHSLVSLKDSKKIIVPKDDIRDRHPIIFPKLFFTQLKHLTGDVGGKNIIKENPMSITHLSVNDTSVFKDIDTMGDIGL